MGESVCFWLFNKVFLVVIGANFLIIYSLNVFLSSSGVGMFSRVIFYVGFGL